MIEIYAVSPHRRIMAMRLIRAITNARDGQACSLIAAKHAVERVETGSPLTIKNVPPSHVGLILMAMEYAEVNATPRPVRVEHTL